MLLIVRGLRRGSWRYILGVLVVWGATAVIAGNIYPSLVQRFKVNPNELNLRGPTLNTISSTRGWPINWTRIETRGYVASENVTVESLLEEADTLANVRSVGLPAPIRDL